MTIVTTTTIMIGIRDLGVKALAKRGEQARALVEGGIGSVERERKLAESGNKKNNNGGTIDNDDNGYAKTGGRYPDQQHHYPPQLNLMIYAGCIFFFFFLYKNHAFDERNSPFCNHRMHLG